jgi:tetratricopeptide (TPR) repeat protein
MLELLRLRRLNDRNGAIELGEQLLREFPENPRVEEALLELYRVDRRDQKLMNLLAQRIERDPGALDEARELATYLLARRHVSQALDVIRKVIAANPKDESRYRMGAILMRSHGQTELAIEIYRQGRKSIGTPGLFANELAQLAESRGDYSTAIGEYLLLGTEPTQRARARRKIIRLLELSGDPEKVLDSIEKLRRQQPKAAAVHDIASLALLQTGRPEAAFEAAQRADRYAEDQGEHLLEFGRLALQSNENEPVDLERARVGVRALKLLPERHPESNLLPETSRLLAEGLVTVARRAPDEATRKELLLEAVESLDRSARETRFANVRRDALALKGLILFEDLGEPALAYDAFQALQQHQRSVGEPDDMVRVQMALCLTAMERLAEARKLLEDVADLGDSTAALPPQHPRIRRQPSPELVGQSRARYHLAELDLVEGKYGAAQDGFAALAEEAPEDRLANDCLDLALTLNEASMELGDALQIFSNYHRAQLLRQPEQAQRELETLVSSHPESSLHPLALFDLAQLYGQADSTEAALRTYEALVAQHPEHRLAPRALEATGDLQMQKLGLPDQAAATYERILLEYPDDLFQDDVRQKLLNARAALEGKDHATP